MTKGPDVSELALDDTLLCNGVVKPLTLAVGARADMCLDGGIHAGREPSKMVVHEQVRDLFVGQDWNVLFAPGAAGAHSSLSITTQHWLLLPPIRPSVAAARVSVKCWSKCWSSAGQALDDPTPRR